MTICVLCNESIFGYGNNPSPVSEEGVCCDKCNQDIVIPVRLGQPPKDPLARVMLEKKELDAKRQKLEIFKETKNFEVLSLESRVLLERQLKIMKEYSCVLAQRIAAWNR